MEDKAMNEEKAEEQAARHSMLRLDIIHSPASIAGLAALGER
jgi:hypothetical protein